MTVGPESFRERFVRKRECFDAFVTVERICHALRLAAEQPGLCPELLSAYRHRVERYVTLTTSSSSPPLANVVAFGNSYRQLALERTGGRVQVTDGSFRRGPRAEFVRGAPVRAPFRVMHKLPHGALDVIFVGFTFARLQELWSMTSERKRPLRWEVAEQANGRVAKDTLERAPVLRLRVAPVTDLSLDGFAAAQRTVVSVIDAVADIGGWIDANVRGRSTSDFRVLVDSHLRRAADLATEHDPARAEAIERLLLGNSESE